MFLRDYSDYIDVKKTHTIFLKHEMLKVESYKTL